MRISRQNVALLCEFVSTCQFPSLPKHKPSRHAVRQGAARTRLSEGPPRRSQPLGTMVLERTEEMDGFSYGVAGFGGGIQAGARISLVSDLLDATAMPNGILKQ